MMDLDRQELTRRQALKALAALAGGTALAFLPQAWKTPVVSVGTLPAHAQVSGIAALCEGDMCATATTTTLVEGEGGEEYGDFDFSMCTPNGFYIWDESTGDGATSSPDNISFDPIADNEWLRIGAGAAVAGTYSIYLENYSEAPLEITIEIITATGVHTTTLILNENRAVADVAFPGGAVTWRSDPGDPSCWSEEDHAFIKGK
jgi:hypothetical protein